MDYFSICDGIGAAHSALLPLGFRCVGVSEINKFCNRLIYEKYGFKNYGDFTKWKDWGQLNVDCIVGSTPCTAFSFMGRRRGTQDPAGALTPVFVRFVCRHKPRWFIWENVPGVLSISRGRLFEWMLDQFSKCGYNCAWRVLDAQYFGVAARRRRVFLVGCADNGYSAVKVLFDGKSIPIPTPQSEGAGKNNSRTATVDFRNDRYRNNGKIVGTLIASCGGGAERIGSIIIDNNRPRWLTPVERERLMGFEDNYTFSFSDSQRHRMIGNSIAIPVLRWIGQRILQQDREATLGRLRAG